MRYTRVRAHKTPVVLPLHGHDEPASAPPFPTFPCVSSDSIPFVEMVDNETDSATSQSVMHSQELDQRQKVPLEERKLVSASNYTLRRVGMAVKP
jgi:hypothetical protein